jgi:hypothetical protein
MCALKEKYNALLRNNNKTRTAENLDKTPHAENNKLDYRDIIGGDSSVNVNMGRRKSSAMICDDDVDGLLTQPLDEEYTHNELGDDKYQVISWDHNEINDSEVKNEFIDKVNDNDDNPPRPSSDTFKGIK